MRRINIPTLSSKVPAEIRRMADALKNWFTELEQSGGLATLPTVVETVENALQPYTPADPTIPPRVTGFAANGAFRAIILTWDDLSHLSYFSHVEVWRADVDDLGQAVKVGTTAAPMYADYPSIANVGTVYYYWARAISKANIAGPFNATAGTAASTADDPSYLLDVLTGELTESQLYAALRARIDLIDMPVTGLLDRLGIAESDLTTLSASVSELTIPSFDSAYQYSAGDLFRHDGQVYRVLDPPPTPTNPTPPNATYYEVQQDTYTLSALIAAANETRANYDSAIASQVLLLKSQVDRLAEGVLEGGLATDKVTAVSSALVVETREAVADESEARAVAVAALQAQVDDNVSAIQAEQIARATETSALASSITTLQTTVGENTAAIETNAESIDGIEAKYTVKVDVNGHVAGYGLIATANTATPTSEFMILADKFSIAPVATDPDAADAAPFFHLTVPTTVDGVELPAGTYLKKAYITDLTATNIRAGSITVDRLYTPYATLAEAIIGTGHITNAMIGDVIQSDNYVPSVSGWMLNKDGNAFITGTIEASALKADTAMVYEGNIVNANVTTLKIAGNAVTVPVSLVASGTTGSDITAIDLFLYDFTSIGVPLFICCEASGSGIASNINSSYGMTLYMGDDAVFSWSGSNYNGYAISFLRATHVTSVVPSAGSHTFHIRLTCTNPAFLSLGDVKLFLLECKR